MIPSLPSSILHSLPDVVIWVKPVRSGEQVSDFVIGYANARADAAFPQHPGIAGLCIRKDNFPSPKVSASIFANLADALDARASKEFSFFMEGQDRFVDIQCQPHEEGLLCISRDRLAQREAERREQKTWRTLRSIVGNSSTGIVVYESVRDGANRIVDFRLVVNNDRSNELAGLQTDRKVTFRAVLEGVDAGHIFDQYVAVVETGQPMQREQYIHRVQRWISVSVSKLDDGFVSMLTDITELKSSQRELEHQSQYLDSILNTSLNAVVTMEAVVDHDDEIVDLRYVQVNDRFLEWLFVERQEVIGETMLHFFPNTKGSGIFEVYREVIRSGIPQHVEVSYTGPNGVTWFDLSVAQLDAVTAVGTFNDITKSREAFQQVKEQKRLLDNILRYSSNGITVPEVMRDEEGKIYDVRTLLVNEAAVKFTGLSREVYLSTTAVQLEPNIMQSPYYQLCLKTLETGESSTIQYQLESTGRWLEISISRMDKDRLITIFTDITDSREAVLAIERSAAKIRAVIDTSQSGVFTGSPVRDEQGEIIDFKFNLVNRALATFTGQEPEALIGALGSRWFARYKDNGMFDRLKDTYETGNRNQFDFFYEGQNIEAWINIVITKLDDEIIGTFTDFSSLKKTQLQLERTVEELQRSNATLQEFAYAASHDLKEPVRKVRIFSDQLSRSLEDRMTDEEKSYFVRMERASARMGSLIDDLLSFSQVSFSPKMYEDVDMNLLMQQVLSDLDLEIEEKGATVHVDRLFRIKGYPRQLQQAFQNLVGNGLKYGKPGVPPLITVSCSKVVGGEVLPSLPADQLHRRFYCVSVLDDGVGFEQKDADKIFNVFTRLHTDAQYRGSGVGLSIVRKVVQNHNGHVTAESEPGKGSRFNVYLPADEPSPF